MTIKLKRNDAKSKIGATFADSAGNPIDLTGATVVFSMKPREGSGALKVNRAPAAVLSPATAGKAEYELSASDIDTAGLFLGEFEATLPDGSVITFPRGNVAEQYLTILIVEDLA